jgi:hypothetical protein
MEEERQREEQKILEEQETAERFAQQIEFIRAQYA